MLVHPLKTKKYVYFKCFHHGVTRFAIHHSVFILPSLLTNWFALIEEKESRQKTTCSENSCTQLNAGLHLNQGGFHLTTGQTSAGMLRVK